MKIPKIARRQFLQYPLAGVAASAAASAFNHSLATAQDDPADAPNGRIVTEADVLVVGGGTAGAVAAIQAARLGLDTIVVERGSQLGGTATTGGVSFPGLFDAWGTQIIAGIGWEMVRECVELDGGAFPDFSRVPQRHWQNQVYINPFLYALLAEEKCEQAGVHLAYYEYPHAITEAEGGWQVDCVGFGTERRVLCKQIIDCTGGASVVGMLRLPRLREAETQPGSMLFKMDTPINPGRPQGPGSGLLDSVYVHGADSSTSRTVTAANLQGRKTVLERIRNEGKRLMHLQPEASFRESYRIHGETIITVADYTAGRIFDDAVCYAFYPVDLHTRTGVRPEPLARGVVPTIPLSALVPKGSRNIMVAGRSVSSDRLANSGLRVQASCMAMGQVAGVTAALAVQNRRSPLAVPLQDIRDTLRQHGAIVPQV